MLCYFKLILDEMFDGVHKFQTYYPVITVRIAIAYIGAQLIGLA